MKTLLSTVTIFFLVFGIRAQSNLEKIQGLEMITVEGGKFLMGCTDSTDIDCYDLERPYFEAVVPTFKISKMVISNAQYVVFLNVSKVGSDGVYPACTYDNRKERDSQADPSRLINVLVNKKYIEFVDGKWQAVQGYEDYPMVNLNWYGAYEFCRWAGGRLPTEEEWEYAAKGGQKSKGYRFAGSNTIEDVGWSSETSGGMLQAVAQKMPNELGLYDMSGNVWEWTSSWVYGYTENGPDYGITTIDPERSIRGGSWNIFGKFCRVTQRKFVSPSLSANRVGFRLVMP